MNIGNYLQNCNKSLFYTNLKHYNVWTIILTVLIKKKFFFCKFSKISSFLQQCGQVDFRRVDDSLKLLLLCDGKHHCPMQSMFRNHFSATKGIYSNKKAFLHDAFFPAYTRTPPLLCMPPLHHTHLPLPHAHPFRMPTPCRQTKMSKNSTFPQLR